MSNVRAAPFEIISDKRQDYALTREQMMQHQGKIEGIQADKGYFVLLQHTFGRNRQLKRILKKMSAGIEAQIHNESQLQRTQRSSFAKRIDVNQSFRQNQGNHNVSGDQSQKERNEQRENWKSLMLRRKNNGKKGQIIKGNTSKSSASLASSQQKSPVKPSKTKANPTNALRYPKADPQSIKEDDNIRIRINSIRLSSLPHESHPVRLKNSLSSDKGCLPLKQAEPRPSHRKTVVTFPDLGEPSTNAERSLSPWETEGRVMK